MLVCGVVFCLHQSVCRIRGSILHQSDSFISVCIKHQSNCHIVVCISQQSDCCLKVCVLHQSYHSIWISCTNHSISVLLSCKYVMESGDSFVWHNRLSQVWSSNQNLNVENRCWIVKIKLVCWIMKLGCWKWNLRVENKTWILAVIESHTIRAITR